MEGYEIRDGFGKDLWVELGSGVRWAGWKELEMMEWIVWVGGDWCSGYVEEMI